MQSSVALLFAFTATVTISCPIKSFDRNKFGDNFDDAYTLLVNETRSTYYPWDGQYMDEEMDGPEEEYVAFHSSYKLKYLKRNLTAKSWQAGNTRDSIYEADKADENGDIYHYYAWDMRMQNYKCKKYKKSCVAGIQFDDSHKLINTITEGNKVYLQYYKYEEEEDDWGRWHVFWTTVYDKVTGSYLPYRKDTHYQNDDGWRRDNITYTATQFDWLKLPSDC